MGRPPGHATGRKRRRKLTGRQPHGLQNQGREEFDIGPQIATRFYLFQDPQDNLLDTDGQII